VGSCRLNPLVAFFLGALLLLAGPQSEASALCSEGAEFGAATNGLGCGVASPLLSLTLSGHGKVALRLCLGGKPAAASSASSL